MDWKVGLIINLMIVHMPRNEMQQGDRNLLGLHLILLDRQTKTLYLFALL